MTKVACFVPKKKASGMKLKLLVAYQVATKVLFLLFGKQFWAWLVVAHPAKAAFLKGAWAPVAKGLSWIAGVAVGAFEFAVATAA